MRPLVSIIVPLYNSENYIVKLLDSILQQEYQKLELILIDDGSIDNTSDLIKVRYETKLRDLLFSYKYIRQKNSGQASAVNKALKYVTGKYLTWIDSDDWLTIDALNKKVDFLEKNREYGFVRTDGYIINELTNTSRKYSDYVDFQNESIFEDLIFERNVYFCPIGYLVRTEVLFSTICNKEIYISRGGQNWQLLLPLANKAKCGYIDEPLFYYLVRNKSHSRTVENVDQLILKYKEHRVIIENTLSRMGIIDKYIDSISRKYDNIFLSITFRNLNGFKIIKNNVKFSNLTIKSKIKYIVLLFLNK